MRVVVVGSLCSVLQEIEAVSATAREPFLPAAIRLLAEREPKGELVTAP